MPQTPPTGRVRPLRTAAALNLLLMALLTAALPGGATPMPTPTLPPLAAGVDPQDARMIAAADAFLAHLANGRFEDAARLLRPDAASIRSPDLARRSSAARLQLQWATEGSVHGELENRGSCLPRVAGGRRIFAAILQFEQATLQAQVRVDADANIVSFRLVSHAETISEMLVADNEVSALPIQVGDLPGVLTLPPGNGPFPAVVLVHGSGFVDRDASIGPNRPFRDISNGLAHLGIATLRYDKRPVAQSRTLGPQSNADDVTVNDAVAAVAMLARQPGIDRGRLFIAGHSLGGLLAPRIAERSPDADGVVMLSALARPFHHAIAAQVRHLAEVDGIVSDLERVSIASAERQRDEIDAMLSGGPDPREPMLRIPAPYWRHLGSYDAIATARGLPLPMLFIQGGRDYQVTAEDDLARWRAALAWRGDVEFREYPALNHFLMAGEGPATSREYFEHAHVDTAVILDIAAWIHAREARGAP